MNSLANQSCAADLTVYERARFAAPATCGELMQGWLEGRDFLVNSPIDWFSVVEAQLKGELTLDEADQIQVVTKGQFSKLKKVCSRASRHLDGPVPSVQLDVLSSIPRGKGLASSTSELVSGVASVADVWGLPLTTEMITEVLLEVDRSTDSVYLPGITMRNHLTGQLLKAFGPPPPLKFIIVDSSSDAAVDTMSFDRERARAVAREHQSELRVGMTLLSKGFLTKSPAGIASGATLSAAVNQHVLYKAPFKELLLGTKEQGALGVNCAHTGTVLGVMFDPTTTDEFELTERVGKLVGQKSILGAWTLISGGLRKLEK